MRYENPYIRHHAVLALAAPLAFAQSSQQSAQQSSLQPHKLQPNEHLTNLPGITTIEAPPAGFNVPSAPNEELAYYGFPPRPDQSAQLKAYASWTKAMNHSHTRMVPTLEQTNIQHSPLGPRVPGNRDVRSTL